MLNDPQSRAMIWLPKALLALQTTAVLALLQAELISGKDIFKPKYYQIKNS